MSCDICGKNNCMAAFHSVGRQQAYDDAINSDKSNLLSEIAALREQLAKAQSEYICTCGIRVTPHRCPTDNDF